MFPPQNLCKHNKAFYVEYQEFVVVKAISKNAKERVRSSDKLERAIVMYLLGVDYD
jgi:hypothetical protein